MARIDTPALLAGSIRLASGVSFLVSPVKANRFWGDKEEPVPTTRLLLRSMGYRDALIEHLAQLYNGAGPSRRQAQNLAELTGAPYTALDRQYGEYMRSLGAPRAAVAK